jgi:hypothetical protein
MFLATNAASAVVVFIIVIDAFLNSVLL